MFELVDSIFECRDNVSPTAVLHASNSNFAKDDPLMRPHSLFASLSLLLLLAGMAACKTKESEAPPKLYSMAQFMDIVQINGGAFSPDSFASHRCRSGGGGQMATPSLFGRGRQRGDLGTRGPGLQVLGNR